MRYLTLLIMSSFLNLSIQAQCDSLIIGTWKPISVFTGEVYYNFLNDSVSVSDEMKINYPDSSARSNVISMIKLMFTDFTYTFKNDNSYEMSLMDEVILKGTYCFYKERNILHITSKNGAGTLATDTLKASISNDILFIRISLEDEDFFEFNLKRENSDTTVIKSEDTFEFNTFHTNQTAHERSSTSLFLYTSKVQRQQVHVFSPLTISNSK